MNIDPELSVARFEKLAPGDLFLYLDGEQRCVALKTQPAPRETQCLVALLGPTFPRNVSEPQLLNWQGVTAVSFGQTYSVILPTTAAAWSNEPPPREILCLGRTDENLYVRVNGSMMPNLFLPYFVELSTGAVLEQRVPRTCAYVCEWELAVLDATGRYRAVLTFPYR